MKLRTITISAAAALLLASCEKELDFHYHDLEPQTVVEATLTEEGPRVTLTRTTPMDKPTDTSTLTDATVCLTDLSTGMSRLLPLRGDGSYGDGEPGIPGHEYRMEVSRAGESYEAECAMRGPVEITALDFRWIKMPYDHVAVLQVSFTDSPAADDCYWVRLLRNGKPYSWMAVDDCHASGGLISIPIMTSRRDTEEEDEKAVLLDGDVVTVIVSPVSRSMLDYIMALEQDSNGPRMWQGAFCLGYFLAAPQSVSTITYRPGEMQEYR